MKYPILSFFFVVSVIPNYAQYTGGTGKGDVVDLFRGTNNGPQVAQLFFANTPTFVAPNEPFSVQVEIKDAVGNFALFTSEANAPISLFINNNPAAGTLSGTTSLNAVNAQATFSGISIDNAGFGYTLRAESGSLPVGISSAIEVLGMYAGSSGKGDARLTSPLSTQNGESVILWRGGAVGNESNWATAANWVGATLPSSSDNIVIEPNGNGFNPVLEQDRTIRSLYFNSANKKVVLGNFNLNVSEEVFRANANHYFQTNGTGSLRRTLNTGSSFLFPVGNSTYNPVTITNNTGTADDFSVRVSDAVLQGGTSGNALTTPRVNRTWHIDKVNNPSAADDSGVNMVFQWAANQETGTMAAYRLNHHNGSGWVFATGYDVGSSEGVTGTDPKTLTFIGYKGTFSPFAIGGSPVSPLPIVLQEFTAQCAEEGVTLNWITESEINNERFFIHRSADLIQWEEVLTLPGAGNSNAPLSYTATDERRLKGISYYRLTQQDYDGTAESFDPVSITCQSNGGDNALHVYPNPAEDEFTVSIYVSQTISEALLELYDLNGRVVAVGAISAEKGKNAFSFQREGLKSGTYILRLRSEKLALSPVKVLLK